MPLSGTTFSYRMGNSKISVENNFKIKKENFVFRLWRGWGLVLRTPKLGSKAEFSKWVIIVNFSGI